MPIWEEFRVGVLAYGITAGAAAVALAPLFFFIRSRRLLPLPRFRKGDWNGREVLLVFFLFLLAQRMAVEVLDSLGFFQVQDIFDKPPSFLRMELWASPLATLLALALTFWLLFQMSRTRPSHLGMTCARGPHNCVLGYLVFLVLTPLVLGLYLLVVLLFQWAFNAPPEDHGFKKLSQEPLMFIEWILLFGEAILSAPLLEELLFRGVLQGWLRRASFLGHVVIIMVTLAWGLWAFLLSLAPLPGRPDPEVNVGPLIFTILMGLGYGCAVYRLWAPVIWEGDRFFLRGEDVPDASAAEKIKETGFSEVILPVPRPMGHEQQPVARQRWRQWEKKNAILAVFGSAMVFAAFHSLVWPTPIPLLPLGIALGFLAYRTQSLVPGIVLHGLFNAVSCIGLVLTRAA